MSKFSDQIQFAVILCFLFILNSVDWSLELNFEKIDDPLIVYTNTSHLNIRFLENNNSILYTLQTRQHVFEIAFSIRDNFIIWTESQKECFSLFYANISYNQIESKPIVLSKGKEKFSFAFDWIHNLLYQSFNNKIIASNIYKSNETFIIYSTNSFINSLIVYPKSALIFWSEVLTENSITKSSIYKAKQDGSERQLLLTRVSDGFFGLNIDFENEKLSFGDLTKSGVDLMTFNGITQTIISFPNFGLQTFLKLKDYSFLGISDFLNNTFYYSVFMNINQIANDGKTENKPTNITSNKIWPKFRIIHKSREPISLDRCSKSNCSQLCLPINETNSRCVCNPQTYLCDRSELDYEKPIIIYSTKSNHLIIQYLRKNTNKDPFVYSISSNYNIQQIGYSFREKLIFWSVEQNHKYMLFLENMSISYDQNNYINGSKQMLLLKDEEKFYFTFDWIHNLLYRSFKHEIFVSNIYKPEKRTLIYFTEYHIKSIVICPQNSLIFWSERNYNLNSTNISYIYKANQDGSDTKLLYCDNLRYFIGLTIDFSDKKLYFYDVINHTIHSIGFNGNDLREVFQTHRLEIEMNNFDLLYNEIYYKDIHNIYRYKLNSYNEEQSSIVDLLNPEPLNWPKLRILHKSIQPNSLNRCSNAKCSQLCLPINQTNYRCVCSAKNYLCDTNEIDFEKYFIIYSTKSNHLILQYLMNNTIKHPFIYSVECNDNIRQIGYHFREKFIFWTIERKDSYLLFMVNMSISYDRNNNAIQPKPTFLSQEKEAFLFTYDWIHDLLYKVFKNHIFVSNVFKSDERTLIYSTESHIKCVAINPLNCVIFWTESLTNNEITNSSLFSANSDGSETKLLFSRQSIGFVGLTIDLRNNLLVFCDVSNHSIYLFALNGNELQKVLQFSKELNIENTNFDLLYNKYYLNDMNNIYSIDLDNGNYSQEMIASNPEPLNWPKLRIIHKSLQPKSSNVCSNGVCSQLCLPINKTNYRCVCSAKNYICDSKKIDFERTLIMYSTKYNHLILQYLMNNEINLPFIYSIPSNDTIHEMGFSLRDKFIIWSVERKHNFTLYLLNLNNSFDENKNLIEAKPIVLWDGSEKFNFVFDWIHNLLYRSYNNRIVVSNVYKLKESVDIYTPKSNNISEITVYPEYSFMFWSEQHWSQQNKSKTSFIYRANQDGSEQKLLLTLNNTELFGLTIDFQNNLLLFCDRDSYSLYSISLNGFGLKLISYYSSLYSTQFVRRFELINNIYYFSHLSSILKIDFVNENQSQPILFSTPEPLLWPKFRIIDKSLERNTLNRCANADCSQLCLPINKTHYKCVCSKSSLLCETRIGNVSDPPTSNRLTYTIIIMFTFLALIIIMLIIILFRKFIVKNKLINSAQNVEEENKRYTVGEYDEIYNFYDIPLNQQNYDIIDENADYDHLQNDYEIGGDDYLEMKASNAVHD